MVARGPFVGLALEMFLTEQYEGPTASSARGHNFWAHRLLKKDSEGRQKKGKKR